MLVVLTDGVQNVGPDFIPPSTQLKNDGVKVISVGLGSDYKISELNKIASQPSSEYVYTSEFSNMDDIVANVKKQMCHGKASTLLCLNWVTNGVCNFFQNDRPDKSICKHHYYYVASYLKKYAQINSIV